MLKKFERFFFGRVKRPKTKKQKKQSRPPSLGPPVLSDQTVSVIAYSFCLNPAESQPPLSKNGLKDCVFDGLRFFRTATQVHENRQSGACYELRKKASWESIVCFSPAKIFPLSEFHIPPHRNRSDPFWRGNLPRKEFFSPDTQCPTFFV